MLVSPPEAAGNQKKTGAFLLGFPDRFGADGYGHAGLMRNP